MLRLLLIILLASQSRCESWSWLDWSLEQAGQASREAGSALYRGVKELACLKVECCNQDWRPANFSLLQTHLEREVVGLHHGDAIQSSERNGVNTMAVQYIAVSWKPDASSMQRKALQAKIRKAKQMQGNAVHIKAIQSNVSKAM